MKKNKILVTGACGYIGSHTLIELLEQAKYEVISADNLVNSTEQALEQVWKITGKKVRNYALDLCNQAEIDLIFTENPDLLGVIHFAALKSVPESVANPLLYYHNNLISLSNLLKACTQYKVQNFIFSSSCSVYGNVETLPVDENTPLNRTESPYAYSKQVGERMLEDYSKVSDLQMIALRYFNPVGAHASGMNGENPRSAPSNLVPVITQTAMGLRKSMTVFGSDYPTRDGSCIRDYIHVSDIAKAHLLAFDYLVEQKNTQNFEIFNLGSGQGVSVLEALQTFEEVTGIRPSYEIGARREGDVMAIYSDCRLAEKKLGWKPQHDLVDMMRSAWAWQLYCQKNG